MQVANHLAWLSSQGCSASSLKVRRSAISSTLRQLGHVINLGGPIASVLKGASIADIKTKQPVPAWDLFLVLEFLRSSDFEPLHAASLPNLTRKTLMLLLLASARRGSEVHSLSGLQKDISFQADGSVSLNFRPDFLAKNQRPDQQSPVITVHPLSNILAPNDPDLMNCPVRALTTYLSRTSPIRASSQKLLFISTNTARHKDIAKVTLAKWASTLIRQAYVWWQQNDGGRSSQFILPLSSARTHETRAWASSLAVLKSRRLSEVLGAAYWRSEDVFLNYYLRDVSGTRPYGCNVLPAVVVAGQALPRT